MERGSDKHGARMDDAMHKEVEGMMRAERDTRPDDFRSMEPSGEDQPDVDLNPDGTLTGGTPEGMTPEDVERRSELATYLTRAAFPGVREYLLDQAEAAEAPDAVMELIGSAPAGREFQNVEQLWEATGGGHEESRF